MEDILKTKWNENFERKIQRIISQKNFFWVKSALSFKRFTDQRFNLKFWD